MNARRPFDKACPEPCRRAQSLPRTRSGGSPEPRGIERVAAIVVGALIELGLLAFIAGVAW